MEQKSTATAKERGGKTMFTPTPPKAKRAWNDEQRQMVKDMLANGATASVIARAFQLSRNQALGRIYRDPEMALRSYPRKAKVSRHQAATPSPSQPKKQARPAPRNAAMVAVAGDVVAAAPTIIATPAPPEPPKSLPHRHMALIGTGARWCKWPVAMDSGVLGGFLCCGDRSLPGDVYCEYHREKSTGGRK